MDIEQIMLYAVAALVGLGAIWGGVKAVVALTPSTKDDEAIAKVAPHVDKVFDLAETVADRDLDGDGDVGGRPAA